MQNSSSDPRRRTLAALLVLALTVTAAAQQTGSGGTNRPEHLDKPYVILVSLDGFKAEYLDKFELPNLRALAQRGAVARRMRPVFPSLTFPNHYSLVTGLEAARHGIVSNRFYDPARKQTYAYTDNAAVTDGTWYGGEPIWVTAETQGMVAACYFWPGSEAAIKGVRPTIYNSYSSDVPNETRVKTVLEWLQLPAERRPHMITLYFSELDTAQHEGPITAPEVEKAAKSLDTVIGTLADGIAKLPIRDRVYLLLTSDHGMVETSRAQTVQLASLLEPADLQHVAQAFAGPVANIHVRGGADRARQLRDTINGRLRRGTAYLRDELPERLAHRGNPRSGDLLVVMDEGWTMSVPRAAAEEAPRAVAPDAAPKPPAPQRPQRERWGMHGWDPDFPSMQALFLAVGPTIRPGVIVEEVQNIDVYPFMAELLGLEPAGGIDGRAGRIREAIGK
ncbi:MAG TPA: ectonucleotide pyrophosphatase/phosphodiesterase [Vicinamibacterales bacterium]|nr:ectonucleotide pyrophosphatase/phosphodiesterase [Vicinamibacterales bacterium]